MGSKKLYPADSWDIFTLGNFGYSKPGCTSSNLLADNFVATCPIGTITSLTYVGVLPYDAQNLNVCMSNSDSQSCEESFDRQKFMKFFNSHCLGRRNCDVEDFKHNFMLKSDKCSSDESVAFFQYTCQQSKDQLYWKKLEALVIVCLNILIGLIFLIMLRFWRKRTEIEFREWDMDTVTVTDFTVETKIKSLMFERFKIEFSQRAQRERIEGLDPKNYSLIYFFEQELRKTVEDALSREAKINKDLQRVEIAEVCFNFNNSKIIQLLVKRGNALKNGQAVKAREIEEEIEKIRNEDYDKVIVPESAFIIFEQEEGAHRALELKKIKFHGKSLKFKKPSQPSDIIWENRHIPKLTWAYKAFVASLVIFLLLCATFAVIYFLKTFTSKSQYGEVN